MNLVYDFIDLSFGELIYPTEKPVHTNYFGSFYLDYESVRYNHTDSYTFYAVQNGEEESHQLERLSGRLFVVRHKTYGNIYFQVEYFKRRTYKYIGLSKNNFNRFIPLFPENNDQLNYLCESHRFFFVGYVDRNIESKPD